MPNEVYEKNVKLLSELYPGLLGDLEKKLESDDSPGKGSEIDVVDGRRGFPTFTITPPGGKPIHGHSMFDPPREAEKRFRQDEFGEKDRIVLLGFGFGYEARHLLEKMEHNIMIVVEPFPEVFRKALDTVDLTDIFSTRKIAVAFSLNPQELKYIFTACAPHYNVPRFRVVRLPHTDAFPKIYDIISETVKAIEQLLSFNIVTGIAAGPVFQNNIVMNFISAMRHPGINNVVNALSNRPVFVVAPGPSLEKNAQELKRVKGRALVIACDTAVRPLLRAGVEPDCIVTIDYQPENFFKLRGVDTSFAYLLPALEVNPNIPLNHRGRMFNYFHFESSENIFSPLVGRKGVVSTGGSVLTDAFAIARMLDADPIILAGVDLGFPGMKWYADGSFDGGNFTKKIRDGEQELIEVEDINGEPMPTYLSFKEFISWFNSRIPQKQDTVIDATEGGAKIEHTRIMKLADAIDEFVGGDLDDPREILGEIYESCELPDPREVMERIDEMRKDFDGMREASKKGLKNCRKAIDILDKSSLLSNNKELIRLIARVNDTRMDLTGDGRQKHMDFIVPMMERQMAKIYNLEEDESLPKAERYKQIVELDRELFEKTEKACENLVLHFDMIWNELEIEGGAEFV